MVEHKPDSWIIRCAVMTCLPLALLCLALIWTGTLEYEWQWTLTVVVLMLLIWLPWYLHSTLMGSLRHITNAILALKDGDFSVSLLANEHHGLLRHTATGINQLTEQLYHTRTDAVETHELLKKVLTQIDVAVMTFNDAQVLTGVNNKALQILTLSRSEALGQSALQLGLSECFEQDDERTLVLQQLAPQQVWQLHRSNYREKGKNQWLVTLADLTALMRQQELSAWQRMMRVLRHEISNSLAPVLSYAQTIDWLIASEPLADNWKTESKQGLAVIISRTKALGRLLDQHRELTDLAKPQLQQVELLELIKGVLPLETRYPIEFVPLPEHQGLQLSIDQEQINQLLLNLVKNAADAMAELAAGGKIEIIVELGAEQQPFVSVHIDDQGPGLASFDNLFVPFYTTKAQGSGIGLALCRQIASAHQGSLYLQNRQPRGCRATLTLPLSAVNSDDRDSKIP